MSQEIYQVPLYSWQPPCTHLLAATGPQPPPSTFVLTACSRGDDQDPSFQDPDCCKVRQVCRHLAPTGYRPVTGGNLDASCKIPRWFWIQELCCECRFYIHQIIALPHEVFFLKTRRFLTSAWLTLKNLGHDSLQLFQTPCFIKHVHSFAFAFANIHVFEFCYCKCQKANYNNVYTHGSPHHKPEIMSLQWGATKSPKESTLCEKCHQKSGGKMSHS